MSAIYGMYHWGDDAFEPVISKMEKTFQKYKINRFSNQKVEQVEFGCGIQYFNKEAEQEQLPFYDEKNKIFMTADAVLDNRAELIRSLEIEHQDIPDGKLIYYAYLKWEEDCARFLRGIFSFAVYDGRKKCLYLFTDQMGSRAVHYYSGDKGFCFSTTFEPILQVYPEISICEKWVVACECAQTPDMCLFPEITPYEGVIQLEAGHFIRISENEFEKKRYWSPFRKNRRKMSFDDMQCKKIFQATMEQCVKDTLRSGVKVAAMVSSGLDSTAVASVAAKFLGEKEEKLYTYTSVPDGEYEAKNYYSMANEAWGPEALCEKYDNIEMKLVDCKGMDGFTKLRNLVEYLELPVKSAPNLMWIDEIYKEAAQKGCRVLLKGQYGNGTISYGRILTLLHYYITNGHFIRACKEVSAFGKKNGISKKRIIKKYIQELKEKRKDQDYMSGSYVSRELLEKYKINAVVNREAKHSGGGALDTQEQRQEFMYESVNLAQLAAYDTRLSLMHGVIVRDPTKDIRMVQLCLELPMECFVCYGVERRLVRDYLRGIVPNVILEETKRRGLQSADFEKRIFNNWEKIKREVMEALNYPEILSYVDEQNWEVLLHKLDNWREQGEDASQLCVHAMNFYAFSVFLEEFDRKRKGIRNRREGK